MKNIYMIIAILVSISFLVSNIVFPAEYQGKNIDSIHFSAKIKEKDAEDIPENYYAVDVVFVGKAANIRFNPNQILPLAFSDNQFQTFYLLEKEIKDADEVILKQVQVPMEEASTPPEDWPETVRWVMKVDLTKIK